MNNNSINSVHELVYDYIQCAKYVCGIFENMYSEDVTPIAAYRTKLIPKSGTIDSITYNFHGIGCYFEYDGGAIDVDFGPNERCDGFDEYRLKFYLSQMPQSKKENFYTILEESNFIKEFKNLVIAGVIVQFADQASVSHLYYLKEAIV